VASTVDVEGRPSTEPLAGVITTVDAELSIVKELSRCGDESWLTTVQSTAVIAADIGIFGLL